MALRQRRLIKQEIYAQPHFLQYGVAFELDDETINSTICPLAFYDEGMGAPTSLETHPENAAFVVVSDQANCFINSRIDLVLAELRFELTTKFIDDNLTAIRGAFMVITTAFIDDYTAIDELSTLEIQDVLELQTEATDNQGGPLYVAAADLAESSASRAHLASTTPFLDTDTGLEGVAFNPETYYNMLQFMTNSGKLKAVQNGLKWFLMDINHPVKTFKIHIRPKVKRMNKFTYFGVLVHFPIAGDSRQIPAAGEITAATQYVVLVVRARYSEWNQDFNSRKV